CVELRLCLFFFFSSRRRHTRFSRDWSSDVCSSDLAMDIAARLRSGMTSINSVQTFAMVGALPFGGRGDSGFGRIHGPDGLREFRSEERRVGKEWRSRWTGEQ